LWWVIANERRAHRRCSGTDRGTDARPATPCSALLRVRHRLGAPAPAVGAKSGSCREEQTPSYAVCTPVLCQTLNFMRFHRPHLHPKTRFEMWITCLDPVSANSEKGRGAEWAVRVGQRLPSRFGQSGAARELNLVQIVVEALEIRGGLPRP